jgi:hypothetical protein
MTDEGWKTYDEFSPGIDTSRLPAADLTGSRLTVRLPAGPTVTYRFRDARTVEWWASGGGWDGRGAVDPYDAVEVGEHATFLDVPFVSSPGESLTTIFSRRTHRALGVHSRILPEPVPDTPQVGQTFWTGAVGDGPPAGPEPAPTRDLIGRRALYRYSPDHLYEHVYLSSQRYAWQCLRGVQRGHGDVDLATTYRFDADLYVFTFREFRIPVASVFLYDMRALTSTGKFLGLTGEGRPQHTRAGARILPLGSVAYPEDAQPV